MIAESPAMQPVLQIIARVGPSDANVLITGESGTGKGLVAQALHAASQRAGRPFVTVNTGGLSETLFESELFGHVKGAFTDAKTDRVGRFELADGGTLFLDEIANVPLAPAGQAAAGHRDRRVRAGGLVAHRAGEHPRSSRPPTPTWRRRSAAGRFREDLLFRLNTVEIHVPPLRERREDIPASGAALPGTPRAALSEGGERLRAGRHAGAACATPGRATCASSITPSSGPC